MSSIAPIETLDPQRIQFLHDWQAAACIFEGLTQFESRSDTVTPLLAERWEVDNQGQRWIFYLRPDVQFQDDICFPGGVGRLLTAEDVVYTFHRLADPSAPCSNWHLFRDKIVGVDAFHDGMSATIEGIRALDDHRVEFRLTHPYGNFLKLLATPNSYIVPKEACEYYGGQWHVHPVGTGPFRLGRWTPIEKLLLLKNSAYWQKDIQGQRLPYVDAVEIQFESSQSNANNDFLKGDIDLLETDEKVYRQLMKGHQAPYRPIDSLAGQAIRFIGFSMDRRGGLIAHREARRALALAFDRQEVGRRIPAMSYHPAQSLAPAAWIGGPETPWYAPDMPRARALLDSLHLLQTHDTLVIATNIDAMDVRQLRDVAHRLGLKSVVVIQPFEYLEFIAERRPDLFRVSFLPSFPDPEEYYALFYSKSGRDVNLTGYADPRYDACYEQALWEVDPTRRRVLFLQLEAMLRRDVPALYLNHDGPRYLLVQPGVHDFQWRFVLPDCRRLWLERPVEAKPYSG